MSVLSTTGAASLKRSGFISSGNTLYNYYHQDVSGKIYGSDTMSGDKKLIKYDNGQELKRINFIFAKNELIAGPYWGSYTGGKSWYEWAQQDIYGSGTVLGGLNGVGAYRPVDDSVVMGYVNWLGSGDLERGIKLIRADGTIATFNTEENSGFYTFDGIVYSPALDAFFWYDSTGLIRVYDGANPGTQISSGSIGQFNPYAMAVSSDGYPLVVNASGFPTTYTLRKITTTDLSYTNLGTITDAQPTQSTTFVWDPANNKYYKASYRNVSIGSGTLYFSYSSDALTWTDVTAKSFTDSEIEGFFGLKGITIFFDGSDIYIQGYVGSTTTDTGFQIVSTDGGSTWSTGGANGYTLSTKRIVT